MPLAPPITEIQQPAVGIYGLPIGASAGPMVLLTAAQIRAIAEITAPDLSGYVPYTGATGAVNLGSYGLTAETVTSSKGNGKSIRAISNATEIFGIGPAYISGSYYDRTHITTSRYSYWSFSSAGSQLLFGEDPTLPSVGSVLISGAPAGGFGLGASAELSWYNNSSISSGTVDAKFARSGTGILDLRADNGFRIRNLANSADGPIACAAITASGAVVCAGITSTSGVDVQALLRCDSFRIDQTPTSEVVVCTHTITVSVNGTNYKIPCVAA